jgi:hypothetical protein
MSNVSGVGGGAAVCAIADFGAIGMSPDALIAYCQMQLGNINGQLSDLIKQQSVQVQEQKVINTLKGALEQFGSKGPQSPQEMQTCVGAFNTAIDGLPEGDSLRAELQGQRDAMESKYGFGVVAVSTPLSTGITPLTGIIASVVDQLHPGTRSVSGEKLQLTTPPQDGQWQGTIDTVGTLSTTIASDSQIQMLQISSLSSAQQTAVEQAISMLNKQDSTLNDIAKNA